MAEVEPISEVKVFMKIIVSIIKTTKIFTRLNLYVISHVTNGVHNAHKPPSHIFCLPTVTLIPSVTQMVELLKLPQQEFGSFTTKLKFKVAPQPYFDKGVTMKRFRH